MKNKEIKTKRKSLLPLLLTILIMLLAFVACAVAIGTSGNDDDSETVEVSAIIPKETKVEISETTTEETEPVTETTTTETTTTSTTFKTTQTTEKTTEITTITSSVTKPITTAEVAHREGMSGISDKKFNEDNYLLFEDSVTNDNTGKWRQTLTSVPVFVPDYALDYYNTYFKSDDEIHAFIDIDSNTTSCISIVAGMIDVTIHKYVDGEENDANLLFSGDVLEEYFVYIDNGDIEKIR